VGHSGPSASGIVIITAPAIAAELSEAHRSDAAVHEDISLLNARSSMRLTHIDPAANAGHAAVPLLFWAHAPASGRSGTQATSQRNIDRLPEARLASGVRLRETQKPC
jgi:hypothetical protein